MLLTIFKMFCKVTENVADFSDNTISLQKKTMMISQLFINLQDNFKKLWEKEIRNRKEEK